MTDEAKTKTKMRIQNLTEAPITIDWEIRDQNTTNGAGDVTKYGRVKAKGRISLGPAANMNAGDDAIKPVVHLDVDEWRRVLGSLAGDAVKGMLEAGDLQALPVTSDAVI